jgi:hypothetical protein
MGARGNNRVNITLFKYQKSGCGRIKYTPGAGTHSYPPNGNIFFE